MSSNKKWTSIEEDLLREIYYKILPEELPNYFENRSLNSIRKKAGRLGVRRERGYFSNIIDGNKVCSSCKQSKSLENFSICIKSKSGLQFKCNSCASKYHNKNKDQINERHRKRYQETKDKIIENTAKWAKTNKELMRQYSKKWRNNNKDKVNANKAERRAKKKTASPIWADRQKILLIYQKARQYNFHVDHIVPISSDQVCGLHCEDNLQLLSSELNLLKGNRYWPDMWEEINA